MNLAIFFDGTWIEPNGSNQRLAAFHARIADAATEDALLRGVGTSGKRLFSFTDKLLGGTFGDGLSAKRALCMAGAQP